MFGQMKAQAEAAGQPMPVSDEDALNMLRGYMGNSPYIEGACMTKHDGRYYLQYAIPGTQYNVYGDGVYVSGSPLGPFAPAKNNPYSYKPGGFITAAGHGSTLEDKNGDFWHIASMRISHNDKFERRLGLWKAGFDAEGELYCDQRFGDWPISIDAKPFEKPELMLLSYGKGVKAFSGEGAENVTDEDIRTFWKAENSAPGQWIEVDLGKAREVYAVQINFQEDGIEKTLPEGEETHKLPYEERWLDRAKQRTRWLLEASADGESYVTVADKRKAETDYSHDFIELEGGVSARYIRLTVEEVPYGAVPCVSGLRVFGKAEGTAPKAAENVGFALESPMDLTVSWEAENSVGAVVLWGYAPDKLYHSRMVYGGNEVKIGALVEGEPVYIRVDVFNEAGVAEGESIKVR